MKKIVIENKVFISSNDLSTLLNISNYALIELIDSLDYADEPIDYSANIRDSKNKQIKNDYLVSASLAAHLIYLERAQELGNIETDDALIYLNTAEL